MKTNHTSHRAGYTLIELLAVTAILVIMSSAAALMITFVLRSSTKAKVATIISQNGNYGLSVLSTTITNAYKILEVGTTPITNNNCVSASPANPSGNRLVLEQFDRSRITLACTGANTMTLTYTNTTLTPLPSRNVIDTQHAQFVPISGSACEISCTQTAGAPPVITLRYTLKEVGSANFIEQQFQSSEFKTSVSFRNYLAE